LELAYRATGTLNVFIFNCTREGISDSAEPVEFILENWKEKPVPTQDNTVDWCHMGLDP